MRAGLHGSHRTRRWREPDSNCRSHPRKRKVSPLHIQFGAGPVPERREAKGHQQVLCSKLAPVGRRRGGAPRFTSSCSGRQATPCIRRPIRVERVAVVGSRPLPRELTGVFEDALVWERALEPVEKLGGRSDFVVMLAVWEERAQFVRIPRDLTPAQNRKWCRFSARAGAS